MKKAKKKLKKKVKTVKKTVKKAAKYPAEIKSPNGVSIAVTPELVAYRCHFHITGEHAYEMEKVAKECGERLTDRKLKSWLVDNALDCEFHLYDLLNDKDKRKALKLVKEDAEFLIG